jgi:hypothetical protein
VQRATSWLLATESNDPYRWIYLAALDRRFGLDGAEAALERYRAAAAASRFPDVGLFMRFGDPAAVPDKSLLDQVPWDRNRGVLVSLHCARFGFPPEYAEHARRHAAEGGYPLTHVLYDMILARDMGCTHPLPQAEQDAVVEAVARLRTGDVVIGDLEMEALWFLALWGRRDLVPSGTVERVLEAQWRSGGWAFDGNSRVPDAHATYIAMSLLLELAEKPRTPLVAPSNPEATP